MYGAIGEAAMADNYHMLEELGSESRKTDVRETDH